MPCGKGDFYFYSKARNSLEFKFVLVPSVPPDSVAPTLHSKNGRGNMFFTERRHSERSALGLTGSYETGRIAQAEVRFEWPNSILVRSAREERERASIRFLSSMSVDDFSNRVQRKRVWETLCAACRGGQRCGHAPRYSRDSWPA